MLALKSIVLCVLLVTLSGCVSTVNDNKPKQDPKAALASNITLGMSYLQNNDRDRALRAFDKARRLDSKSAEAMQGIALVHQLNGEYELAEKKFKKALKLRADFSMSSIELSFARFLYEAKRYSDAVPHLENAGSDFTYPSRGAALYLLGKCWLELGDKIRARGSFEHALNLSERNASAAIELASMAFEERQYPEAKRYLDLSIANTRQTSRSLWLGIRLERIFGNKDKEASFALALRNRHPYSKEYLEYKRLLEK